MSDEVALTTRFKTNFDSSYPSIPVDYPGTTTKPSGGTLVRFRVSRAPSITTAIGGTRRRNFGSVMIQIIMPTGSGPGALLAMADTISSWFRLYRTGKIKCGEPSLGPVVEEGALIMGTLDVPFRSD